MMQCLPQGDFATPHMLACCYSSAANSLGPAEFLLLREEGLESLGAGLGARKRLVAAQAELHRRDWDRGSLPRLPLADRRDGLMVTAPEVAAMRANIPQHGRLMRASLGH